VKIPDLVFKYDVDPFAAHRPREVQECAYGIWKEFEDANAPKKKKWPAKKKKTAEELEEEAWLKEEDEEKKWIEEEEKKKLEAEAKKAGKKVKIIVAEETVPTSPKKKKKGKKKKKADAPVIPPIPWPIDERFENMTLHLDDKKSVACLTTADLEAQKEVYSLTNRKAEVFSSILP